jgi:dTDP-4-dehydrorhamnose 3,5-epimerase
VDRSRTASRVHRFACPSGRIGIEIGDDRDGPSTLGEVETHVVDEHDRRLVQVPSDC